VKPSRRPTSDRGGAHQQNGSIRRRDELPVNLQAVRAAAVSDCGCGCGGVLMPNSSAQ